MLRLFVWAFLALVVVITAITAHIAVVVDPSPRAKAHEGGVDSPTPAAHEIMRTEWFLAGRPGSSHWPSGAVSYSIDSAGMPQGWEAEIRVAASEMAEGTFVDSITYRATSPNIIALENGALRRTCSPGAIACALAKTVTSGTSDAHYNSFSIFVSDNHVDQIGLIGNNCQIPSDRIVERSALIYLKLIVKHEIGHVLGHTGHSKDDSHHLDSDLMGASLAVRECSDLSNDDKFAINRGYLFTIDAKTTGCISNGKDSLLDLSNELNTSPHSARVTGVWNMACPTVSAEPSNFLQNASTYSTYGKFYNFTTNSDRIYSFNISKATTGVTGSSAVPPPSASPDVTMELFLHQGGPYAVVHTGVDGVKSAENVRLPSGSYTLEVAAHGAAGVRYALHIASTPVPTPTPTATPVPTLAPTSTATPTPIPANEPTPIPTPSWVPTELEAAPGEVAGSVTLNWTSGANATKHWVAGIKRSAWEANDFSGLIWTRAESNTMHTVSGLESGAMYDFTVAAARDVNGNEVWSKWASMVQVTPD